MASNHPLLLESIAAHGLEYESDTIYRQPVDLYTTESGIVRPRLIEKPWGAELLKVATPEYVKKILFVNAGELLSLQYHEVKRESMEECANGEGTLLSRTVEDILRSNDVDDVTMAEMLRQGNSKQLLACLQELYPTREQLFAALNKDPITSHSGEIHVEPFTIHTFVATTDLALAETSTPEIGDVIRVSDRYRREN